MEFANYWLLHYSGVTIALFISILFAISQLATDNDPPSLPTTNEIYNIDCPMIKLTNISNWNSRISFSIDVGKFNQFPRESAMSMIQIHAITGTIYTKYNMSQFWDTSSSVSSMFFNVLHPYAGNSYVTLQCGKFLLFSQNINIDVPEIYSIGWTRVLDKPFSTIFIANSCWEHESITLFVSSKFNPTRIYTSNSSSIILNSNNYRAKSYADFYKIPFLEGNANIEPKVIMIDNNPKLGYEIIYDLIIPLVYNTAAYNVPNQEVILTKNQTNLVKIVQKLFNGKIRMPNDTICYNYGVVLSCSQSVRYNGNQISAQYQRYAKHFEEIFNFKSNLIDEIRKKYETNQAKKDHIAVVHEISHLVPALKKLYPSTKIDVIYHEQPLELVAKVVSKCKIFIGTNIENLAYSIFLNPNSNIIEYQQNGYSDCTISSGWAKITNCQFYQIRNEASKFTINNLEDYFAQMPNMEMPNVDNIDQKLKSVLDPLLD